MVHKDQEKMAAACLKAELCLASTITPFIRFKTIRQILYKNTLCVTLYSAQEEVKQYSQIDLCYSWDKTNDDFKTSR